MPADKQFEILELADETRLILAECELTGRRAVFVRDERPVAILVSFDEYVALRETIDIAADQPLRDAIANGEEQVKRGAMLTVDDLVPDARWNDRLRFPESAEGDWSALSDEEKAAAASALQRIDDDPISGAPLLEPLRGLWTYRVRHLRLVYRIMPEARHVVVLLIGRAPSLAE